MVQSSVVLLEKTQQAPALLEKRVPVDGIGTSFSVQLTCGHQGVQFFCDRSVSKKRGGSFWSKVAMMPTEKQVSGSIPNGLQRKKGHWNGCVGMGFSGPDSLDSR
jgi:hypothetical protein